MLNNEEGFVTTFGKIKGINATGASVSQTWNNGDILYPHPTIAGALSNQEPPAGKWKLIVAAVVHNTENGTIFVRLTPGNNIGELDNIQDINSTNGDLLVKSGSLWKNSKQLTGSYGLTGSLQATSFTGSLQGTASYATYAVSTKGGAVAAGTFSGLPLKGTVNFGSAYPNTNYAISVVGGDARTWTIESKAIGGFVINSNSNVALDNEVYWITTPYNS
jgi:hypothetical protein